jgi:hypothetical protein
MDLNDSFKNLKKYAAYLKQTRVPELAAMSVKLAYEHSLPTPLKTKEELNFFLVNSFENFLSDIMDKDPVEGTIETLYKSKSLPVYYEMNRGDILLAYKIRRTVLNEFIREFTSDVYLQKEISREINVLLLIIQKIATQPISE